ncbi:sulfatase/phosphatase domain-containing protein [Marinobacterium aestuariivivens]|uniref:Sulfatase/phosphatase domain-containing protein n=1 Tax=Marinobacterium aestuariivivens TaxID=1698799 RepID=A0ABW2A3C8_9GAMM
MRWRLPQALAQRGEPTGWRDSVCALLDFRDVEKQRGERHFGLDHDRCAMMSLRDLRFKYVHFAGLPPALYDLERDPGELHNIADRPEYREIQLQYAQKLLSWRMRNEYGALDSMKATPGG